MKGGCGFVGMMLAAALALSACGRLKDDSARKDPKLSPAPGGGPALDTTPAPAAPAAASPSAPADHAAAQADTAARTADINRERKFASIKDLAADKYLGCDAPVLCNGLAFFDCNVKGGGAGYYYDTATVALVSQCGSPCVNPDEAQKKICETLCPPPAWKGCM